MTYKGFRIDKKNSVYDLDNKLLFEKVETTDKAKELIDAFLEEKHKK